MSMELQRKNIEFLMRSQTGIESMTTELWRQTCGEWPYTLLHYSHTINKIIKLLIKAIQHVMSTLTL